MSKNHDNLPARRSVARGRVAKLLESYQAFIRKFFGFSQTETNGFLILLPLMIVILFSEPTYRWWKTRRPPDLSRDQRALDSLMASLTWEKIDSVRARPSAVRVQFFSFDPNTASHDEFVKLGLPSFLATRLIRYRGKGGVFRKKEDLLKMYGLDSTWYAQAEPWISIQSKEKSPTIIQKVEKKSIPVEVLDINMADSLQLLQVYGIGPALSKRIRTFRDKLGGFVSIEQLSDVYGLDTVVVKQLKKKFRVAEDFQPKKININTVTREEFKHPYITWKEAAAILSFRQQHGNFESIEQLGEIKLLSPGWIEKVGPYLTVETVIGDR